MALGGTERRPPLVLRYALPILVIAFVVAVRLRFHECGYCVGDLAAQHIPTMAYTYQHPWDALLGVPSPGWNFGTDVHDTSFARTVPGLPQVLALFAPRDLMGIAHFEWVVTAVFAGSSSLGVWWLFRQLRVRTALAGAAAAAYPYFVSVTREYMHLTPNRGKLLLPLAFATSLRAYQTRRWRDVASAVATWTVVAGLTQEMFFTLAFAGMGGTAWLLYEGREMWRRGRAKPWNAAQRGAPLAVGILAVMALVGPSYVRLQRAMAGSVWQGHSRTDPEHQLGYLRVGRWLDGAQLLDVRGFFGVFPLSLAGLCLATVLAIRHRPRLSAKVALAAMPLPALLYSLQFLPGSVLHIQDGAVRLLGRPLSLTLITLAHSPDRTWLPVLELSGLIVAVVTLDQWGAQPTSPRRRAWEATAAIVLLAAARAASPSREGRAAAIDVLLIVVVAAVSLLLVSLLRAPHPTLRHGSGALLLAGAGAFGAYRWSIYTARASLLKGELTCSYLDAVSKGDPEVLRMIRGLQRYRAADRRAWGTPLLLDFANGGVSYTPRYLPARIGQFFAQLGAFDGKALPYNVHIDYEHLQQIGVLPLLGIRYWIVSQKASFPSGPRWVLHRSVSVVETPDAFPRAWALREWESAPTLERATEIVTLAAAAGDLGWKGATSGLTGTTKGPVTVHVDDVAAGDLSLSTEGDEPFVVATNEFEGPGWTARIDDAPARVLPVNGVFVGALVPAGRHQVHFRRRVPLW